MTEETRTPGKTTVAPEVILSIANLTTLSVEGVARMSSHSQFIEFFQKGIKGNGVRIVLDENLVHIDLYVILDKDMNVRQVSREIQKEVSRAVTEMLGMQTGTINIHVEDIDFSE